MVPGAIRKKSQTVSFHHSSAEGSHSGLVRSLGKRVDLKGSREFESPLLRHEVDQTERLKGRDFFAMSEKLFCHFVASHVSARAMRAPGTVAAARPVASPRLFTD